MTAKELYDILSNEKVTRFGGTITIEFPLPELGSDATQPDTSLSEDPAAGT